MVRYFILFSLIASQADAQSIAVSGGGGSIVTSGNAVSAIKPKEQVRTPVLKTLSETRLEDLEMRLDFLESTLKASTEKPVVVTKPAETVVVPAKKRQRQWFLVSESWCQNCPRAKTVFKSKGWPDSNILTIDQCEQRFGFRPPHVPFEFGEPNWDSAASSLPAKTIQTGRPVQRSRLPFVNTQWGKIDLETYNRNCNCSMCRGIRALQQQYRAAGQYRTMSYEPDLPPEQQPTPQDIVEEMVSLMQLTKDDVLADLGCGHDARILIHAVKATGCRGVGIEIDPVAAESARRSVSDAGLSGLISINTEQDGNSCSDALEFVPERHGVTAITAYLYPELLNKLAPKMQSVRVSASPYHQAFPGMVQHGDVWIWRK